ncbi:hypothetical protein DM01DRAFT_1305444 [Hesseltinella vesiculosa]|uniref:3-oxo-5-alpha-steroid 4-dehydrogenase C-terminal domain-containing protein n=1 Tax=Hesseltinella vesiculosa TaxID=101127 RepID=A0A1X2GHL8_9FUNG|nr:hypothetical protein DM01DRAFT_1305444 [Hesseltinella vesiculosa]
MYLPLLSLNTLAWCTAAFIGGTFLVLREANPSTQMGYSKFASLKSKSLTIPSQWGMLLIYAPSLIGSIGIWWWSHHRKSLPHVQFLSLFTFLHFTKRIYEVLFVHRYSGKSVLADALVISSSYLSFTVIQWHFATLVPASSVDRPQLVLGAILFFIGEGINLYHHSLLSQLRRGGSKDYKIPRRGLFKYVWCPHYLGEIISFMAMTLLSQHAIVFVYELMAAAYLGVRAKQTQRWYKQRFQLSPTDQAKACLIPGVY